MMTKKHIIDELKGAAAEAKSDYQFNKDCIEEAIEFMFDTYVEDYDQALDDADVMGSDVMDSISEEKWPAIVKKAKKDLKDTGSFENEAVEFLLQGGLDNNYDEIHEGGADSSIGGIILKEIDYEDDEDDDSLDESSEDEDDDDGPVEFDWVADVYNDFVDDVCEEAGYPEDLDVDRIYDDFCDLLDEWNEGEGRDEYDDVEDYLKAHLNINDYLPEDDDDDDDEEDEDEEDDEEDEDEEDDEE